MRKFAAMSIAAATSLVPAMAFAQAQSTEVTGGALDTGDNAWVLVCSALVLLMAIPGLSLFYGGLVRTRNFLSVMVQVGAVVAVVSLLWIVAGYRIAFGDPTNGWIGTGDTWMLNNTIDLLRGVRAMHPVQHTVIETLCAK